MNLYFRFFWLLLKRLYIRKPIAMFEPCLTRFWVNPLDLDFNMHMNNGRYLSIMDLGRFDLLLRSKTFWPLILKGFAPVVASEGIRFKSALLPFQFFYIKTQIDYLSDKDFYIQQEFIQNKKVVAEGYIKGRFTKRGRGSVPTAELFQILGLEYKSQPPSAKATALDQLHMNLTKPV